MQNPQYAQAAGQSSTASHAPHWSKRAQVLHECRLSWPRMEHACVSRACVPTGHDDDTLQATGIANMCAPHSHCASFISKVTILRFQDTKIGIH